MDKTSSSCDLGIFYAWKLIFGMVPTQTLTFNLPVALGSCPWEGLGVKKAGMGAFVYFGHMSSKNFKLLIYLCFNSKKVSNYHILFLSPPASFKNENYWYKICTYRNLHMWKCFFEHIRTVKAQIRLRGCAVWSAPSLSANRIIGYYIMFEWRAKAQMIFCAFAGWSEIAWRGPFGTAVYIDSDQFAFSAQSDGDSNEYTRHTFSW